MGLNFQHSLVNTKDHGFEEQYSIISVGDGPLQSQTWFEFSLPQCWREWREWREEANNTWAGT